ncbi:MAG: RNA polymerase-associated protein RapA [Vicinamibacterales bacterium]
MTEVFRPGQRWVSITEPELGLGLVRAVGPRWVTLEFPATGETRRYAGGDPPLRRAAFRIGERIATSDGRELIVDSVTQRDGLLDYTGGSTSVPESALSPTLSVSHPLSRLFAAACDPPDVFALRAQAVALRHRIRRSPVRGLVGGRVTLLPHQIGIASEVSGRMLPRVLLADEVGLGKTIEAGLILHRLLLTGRIARVLVLVPASLVHQWFVELLRRFNLWFSIFDAARCTAIQDSRPEANPFLEAQLVLADIHLLSDRPDRLAQALEAGWDALVVDEAHHLGWSPDAPSAEYAAVETLGRAVPSLLLLTATPEQLGLRSHFARLRLLDPDRFYDFDTFVQESEDYRDLARLAEKLHARLPLDASERSRLGHWLGGPLPESGSVMTGSETEAATVGLIEKLLDQHGTGRVMFRNTRSVVAGFPQRIPLLHPLTTSSPSPEVARTLAREWVADTGGGTPRQPGLQRDPRVDWLVSLLKALGRREKVLLLCHSAARALAIEAALEERLAGLQMAAFHEGLTLVQRDRGAAWFAEPEGARLLLCSEIGSEGRNFQFAHHLVLFDLPLDPGLLEQRIGRLDRIGQTGPIHVHVPFVVGSHHEVLARWYHDGLNAFGAPLPGGRELLETFEERVRRLAGQMAADRTDTAPALDRLIADTRVARDAVVRRLEDGRDKLLEWNSFRPRTAEPLIQQIRIEDADRTLEAFLLTVLDLLVIEVEELAPRTYRLGSAGVLVDDFPGLPADGLTLTADRERALVREDLQFLTWDHPLVTGALDLLLGSERGNCSAFRWIDPATSALYLEALFVLECVAPPALHVDRFLPPTPIHLFVDHRGRETEISLPQVQEAGHRAAHAATLVGWIARTDMRDVILPRMVAKAQGLAAAAAARTIEGARRAMHTALDHEIDRLCDLQRVNRSVREAEIEALRLQRSALDEQLGAARLRLDAVRLIHRGPAR